MSQAFSLFIKESRNQSLCSYNSYTNGLHAKIRKNSELKFFELKIRNIDFALYFLCNICENQEIIDFSP